MVKIDRGVIYVATGNKKYYYAARRSAASLRRFWPDACIKIFTDCPERDSVFSEHIPLMFSGNGFYDKVSCMAALPFKQFLFLDADTYVCEDLRPLFDILEGVDLAVTVEAHWERFNTGVPTAFAELSTGIVVIDSNENTLRLIKQWVQEMRINNTVDQPALRKALWKVREVRWAALPSEYNFRPRIAYTVRGRVKVIHCNAPGVNVENLELLLNRPRKESFLEYHGIPDQKDILTIGRNYCRLFYKRQSFLAQASKTFLKILFLRTNVKKWRE
jgi:hypothetical protein